MKRFLLSVLLVFMGFGVFCGEYDALFFGADGLSWETSIDDFLAAYPDAQEETVEDMPYAGSDIRIFSQEFDGVDARYYFFRNTLYEIEHLIYTEQKYYDDPTFMDELRSQYGRFETGRTQTRNYGTGGATITNFSRNHSSTLTIWVSEMKESGRDNGMYDYFYEYSYENPIITGRLASWERFSKDTTPRVLGYSRDFPWGTPMERFGETFRYGSSVGNVREVESDDADIGVSELHRILTAEYYTFWFYHNGLYRFEYFRGDYSISENVLNDFIEEYGMYDSEERSSFTDDRNREMQTRTYIFTYSEELRVTLLEEIDRTNWFTYFTSIYENPRVMAEVEAARSQR